MVTVCPSQFATRRTLFHVLVGCGLLMLKVSRLKLPVIWLLVSMWLNTLRSEERFSRNAETDLVCRLLLEKKKHRHRVRRLRLCLASRRIGLGLCAVGVEEKLRDGVLLASVE